MLKVVFWTGAVTFALGSMHAQPKKAARPRIEASRSDEAPPPEAPTTPRGQYQAARWRAFEMIQGDPCKWKPAELDRVGGELSALAAAAGIPDQGDRTLLGSVANFGCQRQQTGAVPTFESIVFLIGFGVVEPCEYSPYTDYAPLLSRTNYIALRNHVWYNDSGKRRFETYFDRADQRQRGCFLDLIKSQLMSDAAHRDRAVGR